MKKWNGYDSTGKYKYPQDEIDLWDMTISKEGTVYFRSRGKNPRTMIWCPAKKLTAHMRRLCV